MALHVIARFDVQPDKVGEAADILRDLTGPIRGDAGCIRCHLVVDEESPATYLYIEEWRDAQALEQHLKDPEVLRLVDQVAPLLTRPFRLNRYSDSQS